MKKGRKLMKDKRIIGNVFIGYLRTALTCLCLLLPAILIVLPVLLILTGSVMDSLEMKAYLLPAFGGGEGFIQWKLMPDYPTFEHFGRLLFMTPSFFVLFWNSVKLVCCILIGQLIVGVPAAWAFAAYSVRGSRALFALYVVLMLLPFQVTMLSSYLVLDRLSLMNTHGAIILPAVFSTFPIFLSYGGFRALPPQLMEAARIDGAGELLIFVKIGLPLGKSGLLSAIVLGFLEYWNLMEQPLAFLEDKALWPLSLYLPEISWMQAGFALCASFITLIPAAFVFVLGQDYLEQGIIYSGLKE
ncbi:MAG: carbohydrate ABC transporter permease [Lachnospiraceae bacterium]|nr:carbohydrate ABC transporter permease [Lachnospiraceae bacterium]MDE7179511.1 carbohydrate ABC transporter permease [Lachnospiraceae bacterium]